MATYIRLTEYKSSDEKERGFFDSKNRYEAKQEDFFKIPGSPIAYWVSSKVREIFEKSEKLGEIADVKKGMDTSNNNYFIKYWYEIKFKDIGFNFNSLESFENSKKIFAPYNKGGDYRKWYGNNEFVIYWKNKGKKIKNSSGNLRSPHLYFKLGISWSSVTMGGFGNRISNGFIFDSAGSSAFIYKKHDTFYLLSLMNNNISTKFLQIINPTINYTAGSVGKLPIIFPKSPEIKQKIDQLTGECIEISKEEWDSRETSWDFKTNEIIRFARLGMHSHAERGNEGDVECSMLNVKEDNSKLKIKNLTLETIYNRFCSYWREKFYKLHQNEEELNRLFINIYELQDELTPDVELKDITILKNEAKIIDNELVFQADEIIKQFISYTVGVMFGRYSLDHKGLHVANINESLDEVNLKFNIKNPTFEADEDNIIPVLEGEYFSDDIVSRFIKFVEVTFGKEHLSENIAFIEKSLGKGLRKYFVKDFYEDHLKRYKKRPIYWMVSSPKKGFMALIYMHRYKSDIFASIQNDYVREYIAKLEAKKDDEQRVADDSSNSPAQRKKAQKEVDRIGKLLDEVIKFDREILTKFATQRVEMDLDDGVKVNYCRFKEVLYPIKGLCK